MSPLLDLSPAADLVEPIAPNSLPFMVASVTVDFDKSVLIQMALFSLLILLLKPLLLDPMLRVFALREKRTEGAKSEARNMQERAADILTNYEATVAKVRAEATSERDQLRKQTVELEALILKEARASAEVIAAEGRASIQRELAELRSDLERDGAALARSIGSQVIGRELSK